MATFHQEGQTVQYQYNAETINFEKARTPDEFLLKLKNLQVELDRAIEAKAIPDESAIDAEHQINKAIQQAVKPTPDKKTLVKNLTSAKELVSNVDGLAVAITGAIAAVGSLL
jgi:hypothetical protein